MAKASDNEDLLKEIRENYDWCHRFWGPIQKEGGKDVLFIAGDPWDPADIRSRDRAEQKRPHLVFDEGSQYINQFVGQARQQQRAIHVDPVDEEANAEDAKMLQGRIYDIEYKSRAQSHYIKALKDAATRGYGWIRIGKKYSNTKGREQEPVIRPVSNPDSVLMDPNCKELDCSDAMFCFVEDVLGKAEFKRKYRKAKDLDTDDDTVTVFEYWRVTVEVEDKLLWLDDGTPDGVEILKSAMMDGMEKLEVRDERDIEKRTITKYICQMARYMPDGGDDIEILETEEWDGDWIPIIPVFGEEFWINDQGSPRRVLLSMIRRARDPMGLLNLACTAAGEMLAMMPKTRFKGYEGQFEGHEDEWSNIGTNPVGFLQAKAITDGVTGQVLPLPSELQWSPDIQVSMTVIQTCKDAIRGAIGQLASPELDKTKSGIALGKIQASGESAVYHLTDNFIRGLEQAGRVICDLIQKTHDTPRSMPYRAPSGDQKVSKINQEYFDKDGTRHFHQLNKGAYGVTISTGPSHQSQFDAASDFVDTIVQSSPEMLMLFGDQFTKLKNLGPEGDVIADRFKKMIMAKYPELSDENKALDPRAMAMKQQAQHVIDSLTQKVNELTQERDAKVLELQSEEKRNEMDNRTKLAVAEIGASTKENVAQLEAQMDQISQQMGQHYDALMAESAHTRAMALAAQQSQQAGAATPPGEGSPPPPVPQAAPPVGAPASM
jgi:hypothetical protein